MIKSLYQDSYKELPILANELEDLTVRTDILDALHKRFNDAINRYTYVFFMRMDVLFPGDFQTSDPTGVFERFLADFTRSLRSQRILLHYIWAAELKDSTLPHYHIVLLLNGHNTGSIYDHLKNAEQRWARQLNIPSARGLIEYCQDTQDGQWRNGIMLRRNGEDFQEKFEYAFRWSSYLAKTSQKADLPTYARAYSCSRL